MKFGPIIAWYRCDFKVFLVFILFKFKNIYILNIYGIRVERERLNYDSIFSTELDFVEREYAAGDVEDTENYVEDIDGIVQQWLD